MITKYSNTLYDARAIIFPKGNCNGYRGTEYIYAMLKKQHQLTLSA